MAAAVAVAVAVAVAAAAALGRLWVARSREVRSQVDLGRRSCFLVRRPTAQANPNLNPNPTPNPNPNPNQDFGRGGRNCSYFAIAPVEVQS